MINVKKKIPVFKSEDEERAFWATHDSTEYIDWNKALVNPVFPKLKPSTKAVSIRLPQWLINKLKAIAEEKDVPYQSLLKIYLTDKIDEVVRTKQPSFVINQPQIEHKVNPAAETRTSLSHVEFLPTSTRNGTGNFNISFII